MKKQPLLEKISSAKAALTEASLDLEKVISEVKVEKRSQKITIAKVVEDAFTRVREAKSALAELEAIVAEERDAS